ncbi:MAG: glycoside hydrolase family 38 C-terminal domain-containing protein [Candidatus Zhuqueibacterota bacterium]
MKKILLLIWIVLVSASCILAQEQHPTVIDQVCNHLDSALNIRFDHWKYSATMTPDAWKPDFNDAAWKTLALDEEVFPDSAWLRRTIVIPNSILGKKPDGGRLTFLVTVDDAGFCWIDGQKKGLFKWDGAFVLTEQAQPGQKFDIAIKAINTGGPLRIIDAKIVWDRVAPISQQIEDYALSLQVGQKLLSNDTYLRIGRTRLDSGVDHSEVPQQQRIELRNQLEQAARLLDISALKKGQLEAFQKSLAQSREALKPIGEFARQFTLVFDANAHIDCAWLWRYLETINVAKNTFTSVLDMMDARPDFTYTQSQAHLFWWMETMHPDVFARIQEQVKNKRWEMVGGMWVEPDCNLISGESWARQLLYGKRYFREKFGVDVAIGWNPDSFGYNWNMPQFYRDAGISAFITQKIGWNDSNMFPYRLFWWQGPDGSRLLTYFPYDYVNTLKNPFSLVDWLRQYESNTGFRKMLVLYGVGDHGGGPDLAMIDRIERLKQLDIYPRVEYGTAAGYLSWLREHDLSRLPVWDDELYLEYHRGTYTTQSNTKKYNRESENLFTTAEQLATCANLHGRPYSASDFYEGWRGVLFNQFHDILPGSSIHPVYKDSDALYEQSQQIARHELEASLDFFAQRIDTRVPKGATPILIYNPLAWERTDLVELALPESDQSRYAVFDSNGRELPCQIVSIDRYQRKLLFVATTVPALGYTVYHLKNQAASRQHTTLTATKTTLENEFYIVKVDTETGWLNSVYDKRLTRELLAGYGNELQLIKDTPAAYDAWNLGLGERYPSSFRGIELIESGPVRSVIRVKHDFLKPGIIKSYPTPNNPNSYFEQDIILYHGIDRIDFCTHADWWEDHVMLKVAFNVTASDSVATYEIPFGTIQRPTTKRTDWEKARYEVSQQKWSDLTDVSNSYGISLLNRAKYGGNIHGSEMRLSLLRSPKWPDEMADMGSHRLEYALYPHAACWKTAGSVRKGYEYNNPLIARLATPHTGELDKTRSFISVAPAGVVLNTAKKAEPAFSFAPTAPAAAEMIWILRLYESAGKETEAKITLPQHVKRAVVSNLLEEDGEPLPVEKNTVTVKLASNRIVTIKLWL